MKKEIFDKISRKITRDTNLTDSAYRLLVLIINNSDDWKINTTYYKNILNWSNTKLSNATKNLIELGYIKRTKINKGNKGFEYIYEIILDETNTVDLNNDNQEMVPSYQNVDKVQEIEEKATQIEFESSFNFDSEEIDDVDDYIMIKSDNEDEYQVELDNGNLITINNQIMFKYFEYLKKEKMKIYKELINCQSQHVFNYVLDNAFQNDYMYKLKNNLHI